MSTDTGPLKTSIDKLADMLAECPALYERCGLAADDAQIRGKLRGEIEAVQRRIFWPAADFETYDVFPGCVIQPASMPVFEQIAGGRQNHLWVREGRLRVILADEDRHPTDRVASADDFCDFASLVQWQLAQLSAQSDRLAIQMLDVDSRGQMDNGEPRLCQVEAGVSRGAFYWTCSFIVVWGS